jgi:hypothetical protein
MMSELVTEDDIRPARSDPEFRQQMIAENLDQLLEALKRMRRAANPKPDAARQIREGVDLAVKLADILQQNAYNPGPKPPDFALSRLAFPPEIPINRAFRRSWLGAERTAV